MFFIRNLFKLIFNFRGKIKNKKIGQQIYCFLVGLGRSRQIQLLTDQFDVLSYS